MKGQQINKPIDLPLIYEHRQWKDKIKPLIQQLTKSKSNKRSIQLLQILYEEMKRNENENEINKDLKIHAPSFKQFQIQFQNLIVELLKDMAQIVLFFESCPPRLCLLYGGINKNINIYKSQILLLMSMMALNLTHSDRQCFRQFQSIRDFSWILSQQQFKTRTLIEYFICQFKKYHKRDKKYIQKQKVLTLQRRVQQQSIQQIINKCGHLKMSTPLIQNNQASIEDFFGALKVDFANMYIGGGALMGGLVQQQIMFANHPQMYVSVLFCEKMDDNESINFIGFKKYWKNSGYSYTCKFQGKEEHTYSYDASNRLRQYITAIDANCYYHSFDKTQFTVKHISRQMMKARTGFELSIGQNNKVATGNWGCGAFNGNVYLKFLIQWIVCSSLGKKLIYCPFGEAQNLNKYRKLFDKISELTVRQVYYKLIQICTNVTNNQQNILDFLETAILK